MAKKERRKGRAVLTVLTVIGVIIAVLVVVALGALAVTEPERREGRNLPIAAVDFTAIPDGTYDGSYVGGMWKMRANEVKVTVASGKVTDIEIVKSVNKPVPEITTPLFDRVIKAQSLKVDTISMATITSKSFLKSVENALAPAQR